MQVFIAFLIFIGFLANQLPMRKNPKETINLEVPGTGSTKIRQNVIPMSEIKLRAIIKQTYDYSCGSAALSTLLNAEFGERFTEKQVIMGLMQYGNAKKIAQRRAFSLLDMKKFVNKLGYTGAGYKASIEDLRTLGQPCIIPLKILGYLHFAVFRGIYKDHVFLADPWRGNLSFSLKEFKSKWDRNIIFIVSLEGVKGFYGMRLTDDDLRFIDEDLALRLMIDPTRTPGTYFDRRIDNVKGKFQYYKH